MFLKFWAKLCFMTRMLLIPSFESLSVCWGPHEEFLPKILIETHEKIIPRKKVVFLVSCEFYRRYYIEVKKKIRYDLFCKFRTKLSIMNRMLLIRQFESQSASRGHHIKFLPKKLIETLQNIICKKHFFSFYFIQILQKVIHRFGQIKIRYDLFLKFWAKLCFMTRMLLIPSFESLSVCWGPHEEFLPKILIETHEKIIPRKKVVFLVSCEFYRRYYIEVKKKIRYDLFCKFRTKLSIMTRMLLIRQFESQSAFRGHHIKFLPKKLIETLQNIIC